MNVYLKVSTPTGETVTQQLLLYEILAKIQPTIDAHDLNTRHIHTLTYTYVPTSSVERSDHDATKHMQRRRICELQEQEDMFRIGIHCPHSHANKCASTTHREDWKISQYVARLSNNSRNDHRKEYTSSVHR